jgi:mRNA interferase RelE/StbE
LGFEVRYQVILTDAARRSLRDMPAHIRKRVARWIELLAEDPRRPGTRQLTGHPSIRRAHASKDYVILYTVEHERTTVIVLRVENRRDVYRGL